MFYQIFLFPQVKQCAIITYKHGIYDLPQEFPNDLGLRKILCPRNFRHWAGFHAHTRKKTLEKQILNFSRSALFHMKTRVSLTYFVNDCRYL